MNLLIVEDDLITRKMLRFVLEQQAGHTVVEAPDAVVAQELLGQHQFDLIMVDVVMPSKDGLEFCRDVRKVSNVPIIIVSGRGDIPDRVRGLQIGADDYLVKPFDPTELAARVQAVLRRSRRGASFDGNGILKVGDLALDLSQHCVSIARGPNCRITPTEFRLLLRFARSPGQVLSRQQLMDAIWGAGETATERTVNTYIAELRQKLEPEPHHPRYIVTVRGVGYKLEC